MPVAISRTCILLALFYWASSTTPVMGATFNGTIEEVSVDDNSVTVKLAGKKDESKTFTLADKVTILLDGKKVKIDEIAEGQTVAVVTNSSEMATRLTLKTPKSPPINKSNSKPTKEDDESPESGFWPQFRGPNRDNISTEKGLLDKWPNGGPKVAWKKKGMGEGYSSVSIARGKLYSMGNQGDDEMVLAVEAATGNKIWSSKTGGPAYREGQGNGPRGTPTVDDDRIYALGANGDLVCLNAAKGKLVWHRNILAEYGGNNIVWGISESVLVDGNQVICCPGGRQGTMVAINKMTGDNIWRSVVQGTPQAAYSSPIVVEFGGERMYVNFVHTAVVAIRAKDGNVLWGNPSSANGTANCSSPLYADGQIFTASGYGTGCAMFKLLSGGRADLGYATKEMVNHHGGMVVIDGHVYGFDEQILKCIELKTGNVVWKDRSVGKGSLTYADGHLYLRSENGPVALCVATTKGYEERGRFDPPNRSDRPAWSHPVVCGGLLYLRDMDSIVAYNIKK